ncbi:hypothetical protein NSQ89_12980 [Niallia sp. FSL R7-0648]|uniref:hypothetical protein n=1 Tax=Niallia sp. FSL R7-0648 TaxID=2954521 RepID=UPI0030F8144A
MKKKVVFLEDNMLDDEEVVIFEADIPYEVDKRGRITNEDSIKVLLNEIWVDFRVVYQ